MAKKSNWVKEIAEAIDRAFSNTTIPRSDCIEGMEEIAEQAQSNADAMREDEKR